MHELLKARTPLDVEPLISCIRVDANDLHAMGQRVMLKHNHLIVDGVLLMLRKRRPAAL